MSQQNQLLQQLLNKPLLNEEEEAQLRFLLEEDFQENLQITAPENAETAQKLLVEIHGRIRAEGRSSVARRRRLYSWAAAAAILMAVAIGWWFYRDYNHSSQSQTIAQIIQPGQSGAILTLADGRQIVLDSLRNGVVASENGTQLLLHDQQLSYQANANEPPVMNQLSTPRSRQYQLVLPDGTKVWLNAASSIRYPTAFTDKERAVTITGEAYFEVASGQSQPFVVNARNMKLAVLGTAFNVNAYTDEPIVAATLVEGRVKVGMQGDESSFRILNPGQQARVNSDVKLIDHADLSSILAWKNGFFSFEQAGVAEVMRQISRWYDVDVRYEGAIPQRNFHGGIGRDFTLQQVLKALEQTGVRTRLEDRTIIIEESPE